MVFLDDGVCNCCILLCCDWLLNLEILIFLGYYEKGCFGWVMGLLECGNMGVWGSGDLG